ncbi:MAG: ATP synthase F1 subunit gamma [Fimbriimonas sp.]|nr:ATP synthase F1 subunit gamma [Fimbriimonas sp.]
MATLKEIRARIKAAKNIQQITKAMKLVAAARLKRATDRVLEARPYADKMKELMGSLSSAGELPSHPLMDKREVKRACVILLTSDRGLAGGYNTALIRKTTDFIKEAPFKCSLLTVGKKGTLFFTKRGYDVIHSLNVPSSGARVQDAVDVMRHTRMLFESGQVDAIYVCYSKFYSAIRQVPQIVQLLPIEAPATQGPARSTQYEFEPGPAQLLEALLPRYFQTLIWQSLLEATASEFGARMTAMTSATDNAGKMIHQLTLKANRERQAAITKEILEVVGGAEALK